MRERAELLGGQLVAEPTATGFRVELRSRRRRRSPPPAERRRSVLLADDQRLVRESLATMLGLLDGIELVATAADGEEASRWRHEHRPQVVLMDLRMPRLDGIEATRLLRAGSPRSG